MTVMHTTEKELLPTLAYDPERSCPKCGSTRVQTRYQPRTTLTVHGVGKPCVTLTEEHFAKLCERCWAHWKETVPEPLAALPTSRHNGGT